MTRPQQDGVDTRQELLAFHSRYYSANIMTLCVLGKGRPEKDHSGAETGFWKGAGGGGA